MNPIEIDILNEETGQMERKTTDKIFKRIKKEGLKSAGPSIFSLQHSRRKKTRK
jgi:hypothetical protein